MIKDCFIIIKEGEIYKSESMRSDNLNLRVVLRRVGKIRQGMFASYVHSFSRLLSSTYQAPTTVWTFREYGFEYSRAWVNSLSDQEGSNSKAMVVATIKEWSQMSSGLSIVFIFLLFNPFIYLQNLPVPLPVVHHRKGQVLYLATC